MSNIAEKNLLKGTRTELFVRGALAIVFSVLVIVWPATSVLALVFLFGAYAVADGAASIFHYFSDRPRRSAWTLVAGVVSILAGVVAFLWPGITALSLTVVIGAWALLLGGTQIALSVEVRKTSRSWWMWMVIGVLTSLFGLYVIVFPGAGILSLLGLLAAFAFLTGVLMLTAGFQLRGLAAGPEAQQHGARPSTP